MSNIDFRLFSPEQTCSLPWNCICAFRSYRWIERRRIRTGRWFRKEIWCYLRHNIIRHHHTICIRWTNRLLIAAISRAVLRHWIALKKKNKSVDESIRIDRSNIAESFIENMYISCCSNVVFDRTWVDLSVVILLKDLRCWITVRCVTSLLRIR